MKLTEINEKMLDELQILADNEQREMQRLLDHYLYLDEQPENRKEYFAGFDKFLYERLKALETDEG